MEFIRALEGWGIPVSILMVVVGIIVLGLLVEAIGKIFGKKIPVLALLIKPFKKWSENRKRKEKLFEDLQTSLNQLNNKSNTCVQEKQPVNEESEIKAFLEELRTHYTPQNIADRDRWMLDVNTTMHWCREKAKEYDASVKELKELAEIVKKQSENFDKQQAALELNNKMTSDLYKQGTRTTILDFAHKLANARKADKPVIFSREEFRKINRSYEAYEEFLDTYGGTNGEVDNAMKVIQKAERGELPNIEFLEDIR